MLILVEGQTEETFVRDVLYEYLEFRGVCIIPTLARTKRTRDGTTFKGGIVDYDHVRKDLMRLLGDTSAVLVTTMIDFYALPKNFPGMADVSKIAQSKRLDHLVDAFAENIAHPRFHPYLSTHEYEALLFSSPTHIADAFPGVQESSARELEAISLGHQTPEEINTVNPPSKRLLSLFPNYNKRLHGPVVAKRIGLSIIRAACPRFDRLLSRLEAC